MLRIAFSEKRVVSIRFFAKFDKVAEFRHNRGNLGTLFYRHNKMATRFYCNDCDVTCCKPNDWQRHISTNKHIRAQNNVPTIPQKFRCSDCDYECCKNSILERHKLSTRHKLRVKSNMLAETLDLPSADVIEPNVKSSKIECAQKSAIVPGNPPLDYMSIISQLLNQNNELKNFIIEQATEHKKETADIVNKVIEQANEHKKDTLEIVNKVIESNKTTVINQTNNNNQKFNINVFLTEQCKDAINFSDFIKNIEVSREDLENNAQLGFVNGVSKILIDHLNRMSVNERPIHCTDVKRETMYIKDEDKWTREEDSTKINKAIQTVTMKSMGTLMNWKEENPDYKDRDSEFSERCIVIQQQSMAAHNRDTYYPKVVKAVAKEVVVDKTP